jgi:hypothetical protein
VHDPFPVIAGLSRPSTSMTEDRPQNRHPCANGFAV